MSFIYYSRQNVWKFILVYFFSRPTLHSVLNTFLVETVLLSINITEIDVCVNNHRAPQDTYVCYVLYNICIKLIDFQEFVVRPALHNFTAVNHQKHCLLRYRPAM
jgi:hypothetical protein